MIDREVANAILNAVAKGALSLEGGNRILDALTEHYEPEPEPEEPWADSWDDYTDPYEARGLSRDDFL